MRAVIRCDGSVEHLDAPVGRDRVCELIGAATLDSVRLRHMGPPMHVMLVDDNGYETRVQEAGNCVLLLPVRARKPVNVKATALYHLNCYPGSKHQIVGDVVVMPDDDLEQEAPCSN